MLSRFDELGGEPRLRAIIDAFVDRVFDDPMIGFFFARVSRQRIKAQEYDFAAQHLGANTVYAGRPIQVAHAHHAISSGQFMRRMQLLKETLNDFAVPLAIAEEWLAHNRAMIDRVTAGRGDDCDPPFTRDSAPPPSVAARSTRPLPLTSKAPLSITETGLTETDLAGIERRTTIRDTEDKS